MSRIGVQVVVALLCACVANDAESARSRERTPAAWGGLTVEERGRGDVTVVLMHGYGAPGDDLVPLGETLAAQVPARFVMPAAPRVWAGGGEGRAWFEREPSLARAQMPAASRAVDGVIATLREQGVDASELVLAGFSQGAMMALDRALHGAATPRAVVMLSGRAVPASDADWARLAGVPVFVSHGRGDPIIPFAEGEDAVRRAEAAGARVTFVAFDGGHSIPPEVRARLVAMLREVVP